MAENKFVVKTVFHDENGDTLLREDYRETREKAQKLKDLADFGYAGLFGKGQTKVTTEIIERWHQPPFPITAKELCRSDTSSRALFCGIRSGSVLKEQRLISDSRYPGGFAARLLFSPLLSIPYLCREMRRNYERTLIPVIRSVKHISTCGESPELNHGAHF